MVAMMADKQRRYKVRKLKYRLYTEKKTGRRLVLNSTDGTRIYEDENPTEYKKLRARAIKNLTASNKDQAMRDLGLTKVRGSVSGRTYWE